MIKPACVALLTTALSPAAALAQAQDGSWSVAVGAATDNRSKNASKSQGDASVHGALTWTDGTGLFYAGPAAETIKASNGADLEVQVAGGIKPRWAGLQLDLNLAFKHQLNARNNTDEDAWEFSASATRAFGPTKARLQVQHSPDSTGTTKAWTWVEGRLGWTLAPRLEGTVAVGRREQDSSLDYTGWNAGLTYALSDGLELDLRWHDTDGDPNNAQYAGALVAGLNYAF